MSEELCNSGVIKRLAAAPEFCSPAFLVPKPGGTFRLIVDLRRVNKLFQPVKVCMEALSWMSGVPADTWGAGSIDLSSGYYHLRVHPEL